jgi:ATPase involved in DNA repair
LQRSLDSVTIDPQEYEMIGLKLSELHRLQNKHGVSTCEELIEKRNGLAKNLGDDQNYQDRIRTLERQLDQLLAEMTPLADTLSQKQNKSSQRIKPLYSRRFNDIRNAFCTNEN